MTDTRTMVRRGSRRREERRRARYYYDPPRLDQEELYAPLADDDEASSGLLTAMVLGLVIAGLLVIDECGDAIKEAVRELFGPVGLLLFPVCLVILIRLLSSDRGVADALPAADFFAPDPVNSAGGSPVGVALLLLLIIVLLYYKTTLFGGEEDD